MLLPASPRLLTCADACCRVVDGASDTQNRTARTLKSCNIPFFATLSDFTFQLIAEVSHVITYNTGDVVFKVR